MGDEVLDFEPAALEEFIGQYMELDRRVQQPKGLYSVLPGSRERQFQYTLKYFMDPQQPHGFGYTFLESFLDCVGVHEFNLTGQHIEIEDEVRVIDADTDGLIDLVICGGHALSDHPGWAVFVELKVGASEGTRQTTTYAEADTWNFSWFDSSELTVDKLVVSNYVYVKRATADAPADETDSFESVSWAALSEAFERDLQDAFVEYPNRSVIQVTDFIQALKEAENMDTSIDEDELAERLNLYFEYSELIQRVEQANSQFESDFEQLSTYLKDNWAAKLHEKYDFETSAWTTSPGTNAKWQGIFPEYWAQDPLNSNSTILLWFRHSPTTEVLRNRTLTFRLRLPPQRDVHTGELHEGESFNEVFTEKCPNEYQEMIIPALEIIGVDETRLGSASALWIKNYELDPHDLAGSYFAQLDTAVEEFCTNYTDLITTINNVFEETYREVFDQTPAGEFPGPLPKRE
jgi:hypothetical protein